MILYNILEYNIIDNKILNEILNLLKNYSTYN